jgi:hypothetical protein
MDMGNAGGVMRSIPLACKGAGNVKLDFGPIIATLRVIARPFGPSCRVCR